MRQGVVFKLTKWEQIPVWDATPIPIVRCVWTSALNRGADGTDGLLRKPAKPTKPSR